jgi:peptidyl-prolyl cis-trans isomerase D
MRDVLYGNNPPEFLKQAFTDSTGKYNGNMAQQEVNKLLKSGTLDQKKFINEQMEDTRKQRLLSKYMALMTNSIYFPKWFVEKRNVDNSLIGKISFARVGYETINDSTIKVTDDEIKDYINKHKSAFEQKEETRTISYVIFNASASSTDSAEARNSLLALKPGFDSAKNAGQYAEANNTAFPFLDSYVTKTAMQQPNKDSITGTPVGVVYGPYLDASQQSGKGFYVMSKVISTKTLPDSVTARHILVATAQRTEQGMVPVRDDSAAKHLIDSIRGLWKSGQNFDSLARKFSDDPGSKDSGGVYKDITYGRMMAPFNDYIFEHKTGESDIVKTDYGYHLIEIQKQKGSSQAYKIAYLTRPIIRGEETDREAHNQANLFAGDSRDLKSFNENYDKNLRAKGIQKLVAPDIKAMEYNIQGITGSSRQFIKKIYEADEGDVIGPELIGENYVVAIVTEIHEPGTLGVVAVRPRIEPMLRNKKKGEQIIKNIGQVSNPEQVATKFNVQVQTIDSVRFSGDSKVGYEPKVIGASFNPAWKGKTIPEAIAGMSGVYVVRVESTSNTPVEAASIEEQQKMYEMNMKQGLMGQMQRGQSNPIIEVLKNASDIKDNRAKFF